MKQKSYLTLIVMSLLLVLVFAELAIAEDARPANQMTDRGVGIQIRPANQLNQPTDGNGGYVPTQGSSYSSSSKGNSKKTIALIAELNESNLKNVSSNLTNATAVGEFILDKDTNTLSYNITLDGVSNETSAYITGPVSETNQTETILFALPLGNVKVGFWKLDQGVEFGLINGNDFITIRSLLFPEGEIGGSIKLI